MQAIEHGFNDNCPFTAIPSETVTFLIDTGTNNPAADYLR